MSSQSPKNGGIEALLELLSAALGILCYANASN